MKAAVVGSLNMDLVVGVTDLPKEGETLFGHELSEVPGGKGANQAAAIGKLGIPVSMIGKVGQDTNGSCLIKSLRSAGVDTASVMHSLRPTGTALITVDQAGRNHIVVIAGANANLTPDDIERQLNVIELADVVVLQLEVPLETVAHTLELAKSLGKTTILNPAPARKLNAEILRHVDFLIPNEHELQAITGIQQLDETGIREAAKSFAEQGVGNLIVTLGDKGCVHSDGNSVTFYEAYRVKAADTTAAGDSFIGGFVAGYSEGDVGQAIRFAMKTAAITVTRHGAQSSLPTRDEVLSFANS